jgi:hypothetical protein
VPIRHPWGWPNTATGGAARAHAITTSAASSVPESSTSSSGSDAAQPLAFEFQVERSDVQGGGGGAGKVRLDAYLAARLPDASRAKIAASVKAGLISVNGARMSKPSGAVRAGDVVAGALLPPEPCTVRCCRIIVVCVRAIPRGCLMQRMSKPIQTKPNQTKIHK